MSHLGVVPLAGVVLAEQVVAHEDEEQVEGYHDRHQDPDHHPVLGLGDLVHRGVGRRADPAPKLVRELAAGGPVPAVDSSSQGVKVREAGMDLTEVYVELRGQLLQFGIDL